MKKHTYSKGYFLIQMLVFAGIAVIVISGLITFANTNMKAGRIGILREQAFQAAEAGIEYYRWHLAHAKTDYTDGTGSSTPSVHNFYDKSGDLLGTFTLTITPPLLGSTLVTIRSVGVSALDSSAKRTIIAKFAIPSFAKFAVVGNSDLRIGEDTEVFGPLHSNGGIHFDGIAHNVVTSALSTYNDPDHTGAVEFGVHTHKNIPPASGVDDNFRPLEAPPSSLTPRADVFIAGRQFPVPAVDFTGITANLSQMKTDAQAAGKYLSSSGRQGYKIIFKTNDTFDVYKVTNLISPAGSCTNSASQTGWGTWMPNSTTFVGNYPNPANGIVFVEDNAWVEGQINTARVTVAAARFPDNPSTRPSITVNNNLLYTNYNGLDVLSLVSQGDINVGMQGLTTLRIDAALMAQNGRVGRYYYGSGCSPYNTRTSLTLYGMIGSATRYGFAYTDGTGYQTRTIVYDPNLLYAPPPSFPLTSDQYQVISWQEVENN
ncbi:MAG: hypothetical protein JWN89_540 [Parcubacteria group bacterium]|nr:hypothetical protein [Parcubacteria group bacterium]